MLTAKEDARRLIERLPDDASMDDILYELAALASIRRGLDDIAHGRFITHDELKRRLDRWLVTGGKISLSSPEMIASTIHLPSSSAPTRSASRPQCA